MATLLTDFPSSPLTQPMSGRPSYAFKSVAAPPPPPAEVVAPQPNGVLTDIGHGLAGGTMVDLPRMTGQAMEAFGIAPGLGQSLVAGADARKDDPLYQTTGDWGAGARSVAPALATMAGAAAAAPLGAAAAAVGGAVSAAALFGGSTYQDVKERALAAGATPDEAQSAGMKAGALMGAGQAAAAAVGGKILTGAGGAIADTLIKKGALANGLESFTNPGMMKAFGKNFAEMMGVQLPVQAGTAAGMNEIEQGAHIDTKQTDWEAAKASFAPTAAMTTLLSPIGLFGARQTMKQREETARVVSGDGMQPDQLAQPGTVESRMRAAIDMGRQLRRVAPHDDVAAWQTEVLSAINAGETVNLRDPGFNADAARTERASAAQVAQQAEEQARVQAAGTERIDYSNTDIPGELPRDVQTTGESVDYGNVPLPRDGESVTVGTEEGARHARMVANRAAIKERIAANEGLDPSKIDVADASLLPDPRKDIQGTPPLADARELPVQQIDVHGVREERTGSARENADASARLAAAKEDVGPGQGTARMLGLPVDSAIEIPSVIAGERSTSTTEQRAKALRGMFGRIGTINAWAKLDAKDLPEAIREEFNKRGGELSKDNVAPKLASAFESLTGRKITDTKTIEVPNGTATERQRTSDAAKAAAQERAGADPERAAVPAQAEDAARAQQVDGTQGDANAGRPAEADQKGNGSAESPIAAAVVRFGGKDYEGATHVEAISKAIADGVPTRKTESGVKVPVLGKGDTINLFRTKSGEIITRDQAGALVGAKRTEDMPPLKPTAKDAADAFARSAPPELPPVFTTPGDINGLKQSSPEQVPGVPKGRRTEAQVKAERQAARGRAGEGSTDGQGNAEAGLPRNEEGQRNEVLSTEATQANSDRVGAEEKAANRGKEPAASLSYWTAADPMKIAAGHWADMLNFVSMKRTLGLASNREIALLNGRSGELEGKDVSRSVREAAKTAWQSMTPEERQKWQDRIDSRISSDVVARRALGEGVVTKAMREERQIEGEMNSTLDNLSRDLAEGRIKPADYDKGVVAAMNKTVEQLSAKKRGLASLDEPALHAAVALDPHASSVADHIARTSRNPLVRSVAKLLADHLPNARINVVENADFNGGRYQPSTHTIEIGRGGMNAVTVMHEIAHSLTHAALYRAMENVARPFEKLSAREQREVTALQTVRDVMKKFAATADMTNAEHALALRDEHEFVSEALNNPGVQLALGGRSGLLTRVFNAVADMFGLGKHTDFEKLMRVTPDLFGSPRRDLLEPFRSEIDRNAREGTVRATMRNAQETARNLSAAAGLHRLDPKVKTREAILNWTTLNNGLHWLDRRVDEIKKQFGGQHDAKLDAVRSALEAPRDVLNRRAGGAAHLTSAPGESRDMVNTLAHAANDHPERFKQMTEMARRARQAGVDPRKPVDPKNAAEKSDLAKRARAEWARIKGTEQGKAYDVMRQHYELSLARYAAARLDQMRVEFKLGRDEDLNWYNHTKADGRTIIDKAQQLRTLDAAIARTKAEVAKYNGADAKGVAETKRAFSGFLNEYERQRAQPYIHFGRSGDYMLHFEVRPEHYETVRALVNGMDRDMGPDTSTPEVSRRVVDMRFHNELEHSAAIAKFAELEKSGAFKIDQKDGSEPKSTWAAGKMVGHFMKIEGATPHFIEKLTERIRANPAYDSATKEMMVRELVDSHIASMPESSPLKAHMFADLSSGSSTDLIDSFSKRQTMANNALISAQASGRMAEAFTAINKAMEAVRETPALSEQAVELASWEKQIKERVGDLQQSVNTPMVDRLRALAAPWRLGLSAAYMFTNSLQPMQMTLPSLGGRYGYGRSLLAMGKAYGQAFRAVLGLIKGEWEASSGENLWRRAADAGMPRIDFSTIKNGDGSYLFSGHTLDFLNHLQAIGLVNFGNIQQIWRPQTVHGTEMGMTKMQAVNRLSTALPHFIELANRIVAGLAAHDLAMTDKRTGKTIESPTKGQLDFARKFGVGTIRDTDGDHSQTNIARRLGRRGAARGLTPLLVGFNQYDFQMAETIVRTMLGTVRGPERAIAAKQLAGMYAGTALIAGALGTPFIGLLAGLYNQIGTLAQDKEDQPPDFEKSIRDALTGAFGERGGEIAARGLPRAADLEMSARAGYADLAPFNEFLTDRGKLDDRIKANALNFFGPGVNLLVGLATGANAYLRGDMVTAANEGLPAAMRNAVMAYRMSQYGYEREGSNERIPIDVSGWNIASQAMGFTPGPKADVTERQRTWNTNQQIMQDRLTVMRNNVMRAMDHGDGAAMGEAIQAMTMLAMNNPQYGHAPGGVAGILKNRQQSYAVASMMGGVHASKGQIPWLQDFEGMPGLE